MGTTGGVEDLLNQIVWLSSPTEIVKTIIDMGAPIVIALILLGVIQCFFGYKVFRYELGLIGAVGLGAATYLGCRFLLHYTGFKLYGYTAFAAFMGGGMLFTVSAIMVFIITLLASTITLMVIGTQQEWAALGQIVLVISLAVAIVATIFYRHVILIGNALLGAGLIGFLLAGLFESDFFGLVVGICFAVFGLIVQYWMYIVGRKKEKLRKQEEEKEQRQEKKQEREQAEQKEERPVKREETTRKPVIARPRKVDPKTAKIPVIDQQHLRSSGQAEAAQPDPQSVVRPEETKPSVPRETPVTEAMKEEPVKAPVMTETGTISIGDFKSHMKRL